MNAITPNFDASAIGDDVDTYLATEESKFDDIIPGAEKRVVWADGKGEKTRFALLYVHGFSATSEEIRPVPDNVAKSLNANLVYTRLQGHGRGNEAMAESTAEGWLSDMQEALAIADRVGEKTVVMSTSTGGTLSAWASLQPDLSEKIAAQIFVAPNFKIKNPLAIILTWPGVRFWGPILAGKYRSFEVRNENHGKYWATNYPTVSTVPLGETIAILNKHDFSNAKTPALFTYSQEDDVVCPKRTKQVSQQWGGPNKTIIQNLGPDDDEYRHVIAGDTLSPGMTNKVTQDIIEWLNTVLD